MSVSGSSTPHPILACAAGIGGLLDQVAGVNPVFLTGGEKQTALVDLARVEARLAALRLRVLAAAGEVGPDAGARSTGHWLADATRDRVGATLAAERLATALDGRWHQVAAALADGVVNLAQAQVITHALDTLPGDLDGELVAKAEAHLVDQAALFGPRELKHLGEHLLEVIAPDTADEAEHQRLLDQERRAAAATRVTFKDRGDGSTDLFARLPTPLANRLRTYLEAYTSPRRAALREVDALPAPRRRGEALCALLENLPDTGLPQHGGTATQVMVTLDLEHLLGDLQDAGVVVTSTGDRITAGQARRLACQARLIPIVLGQSSEILDLGRSTRLFTPAQRKAMAIRDRECTTQGCSIPAAWCEAHHQHPWSTGGHTNLTDGKLLCPIHHHRAHDPDGTPPTTPTAPPPSTAEREDPLLPDDRRQTSGASSRQYPRVPSIDFLNRSSQPRHTARSSPQTRRESSVD